MGHAVSTTDLGTSRGMLSGVRNTSLFRDFGWRANALMIECAKEAYLLAYGEEPEYTYFVGGSTGGQQALSIAQRFPSAYDGILCGAPANNRVALHTFFLWNYLVLRDSSGKPLFNESECEGVALAIREFSACGGRYIAPPQEVLSLASMLDFVNARMHLTGAQRRALLLYYEGPRDPRDGARIYCGAPIGSELLGGGLADFACRAELPHSYPFYWWMGAEYDLRSFDFGEDFARLREVLSPDLDANDPNLAPFFARGGKLLMASAMGDAVVPYPDALAYTRRVLAATGGIADSLRFYLVPTRDHGIAGMGEGHLSTGETGGSLFDALRGWRERGETPGALYGHIHTFGGEGTAPLRILPNDETILCPETTAPKFLL